MGPFQHPSQQSDAGATSSADSDQPTPRPSIKRKTWIGGAIAAAAAAVVAQFGLDGKADEKGVIGTIASPGAWPGRACC